MWSCQSGSRPGWKICGSGTRSTVTRKLHSLTPVSSAFGFPTCVGTASRRSQRLGSHEGVGISSGAGLWVGLVAAGRKAGDEVEAVVSAGDVEGAIYAGGGQNPEWKGLRIHTETAATVISGDLFR